VLGTLARYGATEVLPTRPGHYPWTVFGINALGCLLIGVLMAAVNEGPPPHRLVRPFLGIGVLGGFTTFSAYMADIRALLAEGAAATAAFYCLGSVLAGLAGVWLGTAATRALLRRAARGGNATPDDREDQEELPEGAQP
jgi:CrcB protein